ncbi:MAG: hypothetical protein ACR2OV_08120 [Hyphomicrobiaceae bacterium]
MSAGSASIFVAAWLIVSLSTPVSAYLDPVTGSFLVQGLIAGAVAVLAAIRRVRERVLGLFGIRKSDPASPHKSNQPTGLAKPTVNDTQQS